MFDKKKLFSDALTFQKKPVPVKIIGGFGILLVIGIVAFVAGVLGNSPQRTWQVFLVNLLYFSGIAQGLVVFAAALQITSARWGRPVKRIGELGAYFLPLSLLFLLVLYFGKVYIFPWINNPIPEKAIWLNSAFLFSRDFIGLLILALLSLLFLKTSLRPDLAAMANNDEKTAEIIKKSNSKLNTLAPVIAILYAIIYSLIAFDLIMSLDPNWWSTLFGAYFFITNFYTGLAAMVVILVVFRKSFGLEDYIGAQQFHDLGKLIFGFCVLAGDFFWSQFLVIWYGNIPEETEYVILRLREIPWSVLSYIVLFTAFVIPFILLISRQLKRNPNTICGIAIIILIGVWLEKFLLVVPSIWHNHTLPLGLSELLISLGFLSAFVLTLIFAFRRHPLLPVSDPYLEEYLESRQT